ncbi:uncharacterized protein LOC143469018 isoform X2 [Clavelina lepadiformis]|uniref:uncharacterized protein LOC143469018 isoform X2 n=1 Tax=Clavelina lepadiformis TaxID=159417 RepID=UPI004040EF46
MDENSRHEATVKNVPFRILKSCTNVKYDRSWKEATVLFSLKPDHQPPCRMIVCYSYGKQISINIAEVLDNFQVQPDRGRVTIVSHRTMSTFCMDQVEKNCALKVEEVLTNMCRWLSTKENQVSLNAEKFKINATPEKKLSGIIRKITSPLQSSRSSLQDNKTVVVRHHSISDNKAENVAPKKVHLPPNRDSMKETHIENSFALPLAYSPTAKTSAKFRSTEKRKNGNESGHGSTVFVSPKQTHSFSNNSIDLTKCNDSSRNETSNMKENISPSMHSKENPTDSSSPYTVKQKRLSQDAGRKSKCSDGKPKPSPSVSPINKLSDMQGTGPEMQSVRSSVGPSLSSTQKKRKSQELEMNSEEMNKSPKKIGSSEKIDMSSKLSVLIPDETPALVSQNCEVRLLCMDLSAYSPIRNAHNNGSEHAESFYVDEQKSNAITAELQLAEEQLGHHLQSDQEDDSLPNIENNSKNPDEVKKLVDLTDDHPEEPIEPNLDPSPKKSLVRTKRSYSDIKRTAGDEISFHGKRKFCSPSPGRKVSPGEQSNKPKKALNERKKFNEFRRAQADMRQSRGDKEVSFEEIKENTSPNSMDRIKKGLDKSSFYGTKSQHSSLLAEMSKYRIEHRTPSPKSKRFSSLSPIRGKSATARRSLLQVDVGDESKENNKSSSIWYTENDNNNNDDTVSEESYPLKPLTNSENLSSGQDGGFQNIGNTCYMNSVLQSLFGLLPFCVDLHNLEKKAAAFLGPESLFRALLDLMIHKITGRIKRADLLNVKQAISANAKQFYGMSQHDAHEFLRLCLDILQQDVAKINMKVSEKVEALTDDNNLFDNGAIISDEVKLQCPVSSNFSFKVKNQITCEKCRKVTCTEEELFDLPVELQPSGEKQNSNDSMHLQDLIDLFFASEDLEYHCEFCKHNRATLSRVISKLPRIMMVYLKRYSYNQTLDYSLKLNENIGLSRYVTFGHLSTDNVICESPPVETTLPALFQSHATNLSKVSEDLLKVFQDDDSTTFSKPAATNNNNDHDVITNFAGSNLNNSKSRSRLADGDSYLSKSWGKLNPDMSFSDDAVMFEELDKKRIIDEDLEHKVEAMTEDEQIQLAMQLSIEEQSKKAEHRKNSDQVDLTSDEIDIELNDNDVDNNNVTVSDTISDTESSLPAESSEKINDNKQHNFNFNNSTSSSNQTASDEENHKATIDSINRTPESSTNGSNGSGSCSETRTASTSESSLVTIGSTQLDAYLSDMDEEVNNFETRSQVFASYKSKSPSPTKVGEDNVQSHDSPVSEPKQVATSNNEAIGHSNISPDKFQENETTGHLPHSYRLVSVVSHSGSSLKCGHYISDVLKDLGKQEWSNCDDNKVLPVSEDAVLSGRQSSAYLLFYLQKDFLRLYDTSK